jgi:hypothetical protein
MTHPIYTRDLLENFSRSELHEVCDRLSIPRRRSKEDCIADILAAQPQVVAEAELEIDDYKQPTNLPVVGDIHLIGDFLLRCISVATADYVTEWDVSKDGSVMGEIKMGWDCFWTHSMSLGTFATPQEAVIDLCQSVEALVKEDEAIAFEKTGDGKSSSVVNDVLVEIASLSEGYRTNLTGDCLFADYGSAIKESLLAVARLQPQSEMEVFATTRPNVFAVYSHKPNLTTCYQVNLETKSCTCPHYQHRHEQEGFKDKHIEAVRLALLLSPTLPTEPMGYAVEIQKGDKPYRFEWLYSLQQVYANLALEFTPKEIEPAAITPLSPEVVERLKAEYEAAWDNY